MKKQAVKYIGLLTIFSSALFLWWSAKNIIETPQTENWFLPIVLFSSFFIFWSLGLILIKNDWLFYGLSVLSVMISFIWFFSWGYALVVAVALISLFAGRKVAQDEMSARVKISVWNSLRLERRFFVFAISLILTGQYFFSGGQMTAAKSLPQLKISDKQAEYLTKIFSKFDPTLKSQKNINKMTVDEFILLNAGQDGEYDYDYNNLSAENKNILLKKKKQMILQKGRENLSRMAERNILGNEKILDVFTGIVNNKINKLADNNIGYLDGEISLTYIIFSILLFLTIFSLGMLISPILILLTWLMFKFMIVVGLIGIKNKTVEMEIIA